MNVLRYEARYRSDEWSLRIQVAAVYKRDANRGERQRGEADEDGQVEDDFGMTAEAVLDDRSLGGARDWKVHFAMSGVGSLDVGTAIVRARVMSLALAEAALLEKRDDEWRENIAELHGKVIVYSDEMVERATPFAASLR